MAFAPAAFNDRDIDRLVELCKNLGPCVALDAPTVRHGPPGIVRLDALPLREFDCKTFVKSIVDVVRNVQGLDTVTICTHLQQGQYVDLPDVCKPHTEVNFPVKMQLVIVPNADGGHDVLKHFVFERTPVALARLLVVGDPANVQMMTVNPKLQMKVWQWLLQHMGGLSCLWYTLGHPQAEAAEDRALDAGFDYIEQWGPTQTSGLDQLRWITKRTRNGCGSPIEGWASSFVEKCLKAKAAGGTLAKVRTEFPIALAGVDGHVFRYCLVPIIRSLFDHGLVMLGEPNQGKTPLALLLSFMMSRYYIDTYNYDAEAQCRCATDLDFFRGDPGLVYQPFILDDGDLSSQDVTKLKAFLDVSEEEAMTYQRCERNHYLSATAVQHLPQSLSPLSQTVQWLHIVHDELSCLCDCCLIFVLYHLSFPQVGCLKVRPASAPGCE